MCCVCVCLKLKSQNWVILIYPICFVRELTITHYTDFLTHSWVKIHSLKSPGMWEECFQRCDNLSLVPTPPVYVETWLSPAHQGDGVGYLCLNLSSRIFHLHAGDFSSVIRKDSTFSPSVQYWLPPHTSHPSAPLSVSVSKGLRHSRHRACIHPQLLFRPSVPATMLAGNGSTLKQYNLGGLKQVSRLLTFTWISSDICFVFHAPSDQTSKP